MEKPNLSTDADSSTYILVSSGVFFAQKIKKTKKLPWPPTSHPLLSLAPHKDFLGLKIYIYIF